MANDEELVFKPHTSIPTEVLSQWLRTPEEMRYPTVTYSTDKLQMAEEA